MTTAGRDPHPLATLGVILVAAGQGTRLSAGKPKAFVTLREKTLLEHCIETVCALQHTGHLVVVVPDSHAAEALRLVESEDDAFGDWSVSVVHGGRERHESVRFGLEALHDFVDVVLVHDAARPLAPAELFERVVEEVRRQRCSIVPALPVADTLKRVDAEGVVHETVDRSRLVAVQTPQGFPRELLAAAHTELRPAPEGSPTSDLPTDDAEVVQRAGGTVRTVSGDARAHKLTTPEDFELLRAYLDSPYPANERSSA